MVCNNVVGLHVAVVVNSLSLSLSTSNRFSSCISCYFLLLPYQPSLFVSFEYLTICTTALHLFPRFWVTRKCDSFSSHDGADSNWRHGPICYVVEKRLALAVPRWRGSVLRGLSTPSRQSSRRPPPTDSELSDKRTSSSMVGWLSVALSPPGSTVPFSPVKPVRRKRSRLRLRLKPPLRNKNLSPMHRQNVQHSLLISTSTPCSAW